MRIVEGEDEVAFELIEPLDEPPGKPSGGLVRRQGGRRPWRPCDARARIGRQHGADNGGFLVLGKLEPPPPRNGPALGSAAIGFNCLATANCSLALGVI